MTRYVIVVSKKDVAGMNIKGELVANHHFSENGKKIGSEPVLECDGTLLVTVEDESVYCDQIGQLVDADVIIFATRHQSHDGRRILSCHSPGNWGIAQMGGSDQKLCRCPAGLLKEAYLMLKEENCLDYEVTMECTHHGPYIDTPCIFIEIGSTMDQWQDEDAAEVITRVIMRLVSGKISECTSALGLGGTHYCSSFNKVMEDGDVAVGHICPKHMLGCLDEVMLRQAIERTVPEASLVLLDWKGLGTEKRRIMDLLDSMGVPYKKARDARQ